MGGDDEDKGEGSEKTPSTDVAETTEADLDQASLGDLFQKVVRRLLDRSRVELERAAHQGRRRLELRQLEKDKNAFFVRLGKMAYRLAEGGEIDHPAIAKAMGRIDEIDARIEALRRGERLPEDEPPPEPAEEG